MLESEILRQFLKYFARIIVLLLCLPVHEWAHGFASYKLGDNTAKYEGRLTLNPLAHLDVIGSVLLVFTGFGWAKPVPVNPYNFKNRKQGMAITALAGPISNLVMAYIFMLLYKIFFYFLASDIVLTVFSFAVIVNIGLAIFNLLPIPPLDGSKVLNAFLPERIYFKIMQYERYIFIVLVIVLLFTNILDGPLSAFQSAAFNLMNFLTGFVDVIARAILG